MSAFMKITRNEIEQVTEHVTEQVVDLMGHEGSKRVAITWRFFGESGDYLAILEVIGVLLGRNRVMNGSYFPASEFSKTIHRKGRKERKAAQHEPLLSCVTKIRYGINNELERTDTNSGHSEFVRVRISSLLASILFLSLRPLCSLRLNVFSTPAHERAPPQHAPAVHLRSSRAGG